MAIKLENWEQINPQQKSGNQNKLKFVDMGKKAIGRTHKLRLLGSPVQFYKFRFETKDKRWQSVNTNDPKNHKLTVMHGLVARESFAVNVIDRADNEIKIFEFPRSIYEEFRKWSTYTGKKPGGSQGDHFLIKVTGKKGKDYYVVESAGKAPLTDEDKKLIDNPGPYDLDNIFKDTSPEKVDEYISQIADDQTVSAPSTEGIRKGNQSLVEEEEPSETVEESDEIKF